MANMGYCRFENTLADLRDCLEHLDEDESVLSPSEFKAKQKLIMLCATIGIDYVDIDND